MAAILTITLNPAIDITTAVPEIVPVRKLRCEEPKIDLGGGGVNVSRMIKELGGETTALVAVGGATGDLMRELLAEADIEARFLTANGTTRQSLMVRDRATGEQYRFVLPGPRQDEAFAGRALAEIERCLAEGDFPFVVASGSLPPGLPDDLFAHVAKTVRAHGARLILDTSGRALSAASGPDIFLMKPNLLEAQELSRIEGPGLDDPGTLARAIVEEGCAEAVIITLGDQGAVLASAEGIAREAAPRVPVDSAVGAGDSFVAALAWRLADGWPLAEAFRYGVAAGAAAVMTGATELARKDDVERLYERMRSGPAS